MPRALQNLLVVFSLLALVSGTAKVQPCLDDDAHSMVCAPATAMACQAPGDHHDFDPPIHSCDCLCHVPSLTMGLPGVCRPSAALVLEVVPALGLTSLGFLEPPFHPPRV